MAKRNPAAEGTRDSIRQRASLLFIENGVHASSLADIAQAAGLSKGTLYYHYPTKEDLVMEIAEDHFSHVTTVIYNWIDALTMHTPAGEAIASLSGNLWRSDESVRLYFALFSEALRERGPLYALLQSKQKEWSVMMEVGALKLTGHSAQRFRTYSRGFLALLDGLALHCLLHDELDADLLIQLLSEG